ncbi:MAG: hypothetical protein HFI64_13895 [Lachnospiraceae bacterium]|nr:hypothetical protein [Lachnospiraceae bacterium]
MKQIQKSFRYIVTFLLAVSLPLQMLSACQNMMAGIRGTCGWIQVTDQNHMQFSLLEGSVVCSVFDLAGRTLASETISAGETADMVYDKDGESSIHTGSFPFSDIPPYVLEEVSQTDIPAIRSLLDTLEQADEASQPESVPETASATEPEIPAAEAFLPADNTRARPWRAATATRRPSTPVPLRENSGTSTRSTITPIP